MPLGPTREYPYADGTCDDCGKPLRQVRSKLEKKLEDGRPLICMSCRNRRRAEPSSSE